MIAKLNQVRIALFAPFLSSFLKVFGKVSQLPREQHRLGNAADGGAHTNKRGHCLPEGKCCLDCY